MGDVPLPLRVSSRLAMRAWFTPPPGRPMDSGTAAPEAESIAIPHGSLNVHSYGTGPLVLVVHGWGADPTRLLPLARAVARRGYRAVVPHLPGRAGSGATDVLEVAETIRQLVDVLGLPHAVVAHSFGAMSTRLAFEPGEVNRVVFLAPMVKVSDALDTFAERLRAMPWVRTGIHRRLRAWNPGLWPVVDAVRPDQFGDAEMLILHDPDDRDTSYERAALLAALRPDTDIVPVRGVGHHRLVVDERVIDAVLGFVDAPVGDSVAV